MSELMWRTPSGSPKNVAGWGLCPFAWMFGVCGRVAWSAAAASGNAKSPTKHALKTEKRKSRRMNTSWSVRGAHAETTAPGIPRGDAGPRHVSPFACARQSSSAFPDCQVGGGGAELVRDGQRADGRPANAADVGQTHGGARMEPERASSVCS